MKIQRRLVSTLATAFILSVSVPMLTVKADQTPEESTEVIMEEETDFPIPDEAPMFDARIVYGAGSYTVIGTFTDFTPDISLIDTLYSLDGVNWQPATRGDWNLHALGTDDEEKLYALQNQHCLYDYYEPLKSYKTGETDLFYVKLRITRKNGLSYETQPAVIERGGLQPIPEGTKCAARFSSSIAARENPYHYYGRYQLTVYAESTAEDISALLPDTLPVEVQLIGESNFNATCIIDCPVTWKPLSLPPLSAGESITISDAAEELLVPQGTLLNTPLGTFQLDQALSLNTDYSSDEVSLVLNVTSENKNPAGVLRQGKNGLEIAFHQKPTSAASIQAYVFTEGASKWTELPGLSLLKEFTTPSSAANSGYALVLRNDQEPYQSYLAAIAAGDTPTPFYVGLKIEGGIYDGRQLVLAWPDIYEQLPDLPDVGGAGGNEGNAGTDNTGDSTEGGQRPNLPQDPDDNQDGQQPNPPPVSDDDQAGQTSNPSPESEDNQTGQTSNPSPVSEDNQTGQTSNPSPVSEDSELTRQPAPTHTTETESEKPENQNRSSTDASIPWQPDLSPQKSKASESGQRPNLPQTTQNSNDTSSAETAGAANQGDSRIPEKFNRSVQPLLVVQAAANIKNEKNAVGLSNAETTTEYSTEDNSHIPLLPVTIIVIAVICIAAAACRAAGHNLHF